VKQKAFDFSTQMFYQRQAFFSLEERREFGQMLPAFLIKRLRRWKLFDPNAFNVKL